MAENELDLKEFLEVRRVSLADQENRLLADISVLESRLSQVREEIRRVEVAIIAIVGGRIEERQSGTLTIKGAVMRILQRIAPRGLTAMDILNRLATDFGMHYERSSLSPQLSRLKSEGRIQLQGGLWSIKTENGPGA